MITDALEGRRFRKMNGLGNDFVILDLRDTDIRPSTVDARNLADRTNGVGCDQVITIERADRFDAGMGIWNADGSEVAACGNAARCVAWLLMEESGATEIALQTPSGPISAKRTGDKFVSVDMGPARLHWNEIPLAEEMDVNRLDLALDGLPPSLGLPAAVNMGNPHCVFFVDDIDALDIKAIGPQIEHHGLFPERTNVGFAEIKDDDIRLRVWERGAGVTRACGTAACAAVVAAARRNLISRKARVVLDGGPLEIEWRESDGHVVMTGPIAFEFEGTIGG